MNKKINKKDRLNLLISAFLILAFVICGYFFSSLTKTFTYPWNMLISRLIYVLFGLMIFYATRVGEGRQIRRFNIYSLIVVVVPTVYILFASMFEGLPLYEQLCSNSAIVTLACFALGYSLPYTFISGFECVDESAEEAKPEPEVLGAVENVISEVSDGEQAELEESKETAEITEAKETAEIQETEETEETEEVGKSAESQENAETAEQEASTPQPLPQEENT